MELGVGRLITLQHFNLGRLTLLTFSLPICKMGVQNNTETSTAVHRVRITGCGKMAGQPTLQKLGPEFESPMTPSNASHG